MMIVDSYAVATTHEAEAVFSRWADPESWPEWDAEVREVTFAGPARLGARGRMRPTSGPAASFTVTAFEPGRVFTREEVCARCYPGFTDGVSDLAIEGLVRRLRKRLADVAPGTPIVAHKRGLGYQLLI